MRASWWIPDSPNGNPWLLVDATPSDTCLGCHSSANSSRGVFDGDCNTGHSREKGAGNYIFLTCPDLRESTRGSVIPGERAGHNLDAPGFGLATDTTLATAPGGTFPARGHGLHQLPRPARHGLLPAALRRPSGAGLLQLHQPAADGRQELRWRRGA